MNLNQEDIDFILAQLRLPGNVPPSAISNAGIRDVQGVGNNWYNPLYGAADQLFPRLTYSDYTYAAHSGAFTGTLSQSGLTNLQWDPSASINYQVRNTTVFDAAPRLISNLVSDQSDLTTLQVQDDPSATPGGRLSPLTGNTNPLPYSSYMTLFGQFFDHGLDFVHKGADGMVIVPLLPGDPLYVPGSQTNFMAASRTNTELVNGNPESRNTVSPFIDLSQSYGSAPSHTVFLRDYDVVGGVATATGKLMSGANGGMATWADLKANALLIGITLHDSDVGNIPLVNFNANGSYLDANGKAWLVAKDADGNVQLVQDTANIPAGYTLQTVGHAFLDDMASGPGAATRDQHYVAGDGRANENIGLTSIHDVFHPEHNRVLGEIQALVAQRPDAAQWTGEDFFQAAKLVTEMEYQHLVFGEFARKISPNINAFAGYDISIDPAITAEFAHAVYRFGHSMLTETMAMTGSDGSDHSIGLIDAFLSPEQYNPDTTAADVARGMSGQVGNAIDEWVTGALRNNLLGLPLDLATLNMVRGRDTGIPSLNDVRTSLFAQTGNTTLKPYESWDDFGAHLLHPDSLKNFVMAYARDAILTQFGAPSTDWNALQLNNATDYAAKLSLAADAALNNTAFMMGGNTDFNNIDLWLGGLAEAKVTGGMLGSTFDFVFASQMIKLQNGDRFYYLDRLAGTNLLAEIEGQLFSDIVMRNTGAQHLYSDIFSVADSYVEGGDIAVPANLYGSQNALLLHTVGADKLGHAGFVGATLETATLYGNPGNYQDARGVLNPNGKGNASEMLAGTAGNDRINGLGGNDTIWADGGNDTVEGGLGNDFLHGGNGNDVITDSEGNDFLWGNDGDDSVNGGNGLDQVFGGNGDDTLSGGQGADVVSGSAGNDVIYGDDNGGVAAGVVITRVNGVITGVTIANYALLSPTSDGDILAGDDGNDVLFGGGGADALDGGDGDDWLIGGAGADNMLGVSGNDRFLMDAADTGWNNVMDGGIGNDTVDYSASVGSGMRVLGRLQGVTVNLSNAGAAAVPVGINVPDSFLSIEGVIGSAFDDNLGGGPALQTDAAGAVILNPLTLLGTPINFTIDGGAGNDTIEGGAGNDTLIGGADNDTVSYATAAAAVIASLASGTVTGGAGNDTLASLENIIGSAFNDTLTGNANDNIIDGGAGDDVMTGGGQAGGGDTLSYASALAGITMNLGSNRQQNTGGAGLDTVSGFENLTGSAFNDSLTGDANNNVLEGGAGNDTLNGGNGNDTASYASALSAVTVRLSTNNQQNTGGAGADTLNSIENLLGSMFNDSLTGSNANNQLGGGAGNDALDGGGGNDTLLGGDGGDVLTGGAGTDSMNGGNDGDIYLIAAVSDHAAAEIADTGISGVDEVRFSANQAGTLTLYAGDTGIERVVIGTGSAAAAVTTATTALNVNAAAVVNGLAMTGNAGANSMTGTAFADTINGGAGNDTLTGGNGNDTLIGGNGNDSLTGGQGSDIFLFNVAANAASNLDTISDFTSGTDKLQFSRAVFTQIQGAVGDFTAANFVSGAGATTAQDAADRLIYNTTTRELYYDADGSAGGSAAIKIAVLGVRSQLVASDIAIVA